METYHNSSKLIKISTWANTLSWIILVLAVALVVGRAYSDYQQIMNYNPAMLSNPLLMISTFASALYGLLIGGFYFLVLQGVSEGINILMDVYETVAPEESPEESPQA